MPKEYLEVYATQTFGGKEGSQKGSVKWRCGAAFPNQDNSLNLQVGGYPVSGKMEVAAPQGKKVSWVPTKGGKYEVFMPPAKSSKAQIWLKVGNAYSPRGDSLMIYLALLPQSSRLHIRAQRERIKKA